MNYFNETKSFDTEVTSFDKSNVSSKDMPGMSSCDMMHQAPMASCCMQPIYECPQERVCHRYICHEVPHIMPCNTRVINHHVYRHTFTPAYTCCEENVCENVFEPRCC